MLNVTQQFESTWQNHPGNSLKIQTSIPILNLLNESLWGWDLGDNIPRGI